MAFEKSNILFNIAAKNNNESLENLNMETMKPFVRNSCVSATIFDCISTNFANAPLNDIKSDFSRFLSCICLLQAQEIAFFSSIHEEKGLKTLARLSLGVINLLQSAKEYVSAISHFDSSWIIQKLEDKEDIHGFIHCLIMAEFWDGEELYDIAFGLFSTSSRLFENSKTKFKGPIRDYLKISLLRSEKESQQISYEGKKAADSTVKLEPYFLANILEFKSIIRPYYSSYKSLFSSVYPIHVIESQSEFELKANTVIKTLERASEEVCTSFDKYSIKFQLNSDSFILELRSNIIDEDIFHLKKILSEIDLLFDEISSMREFIKTKYAEVEFEQEFSELFKPISKLNADLEKSKARLILNDRVFVQTLLPLVKEIHSAILDNSKELIKKFEEDYKNQISMYEDLKTEVKKIKRKMKLKLFVD